MTTGRRWLAGALLAVVLTSAALASLVFEGERSSRRRGSTGARINDAPTLYRTGLSGSDSATATTPIDPQTVWDGDPALIVSPRFTSASATATVAVWRYHYAGGTYTLLDVADVQTATAHGTIRAGAAGDYLVANPLVFATAGADVYDVRVLAVSAGTVSLVARTIGGGAGVAE